MKLMHISLLAAVALTTSAAADEAKPSAQPVRNILERHDQSNVTPAKEMLIGTATLPAGATIGFHTHPGDEIGYVLKGSMTLKVRGQQDRVLKAGDSFFNPRGAVHSVTAEPGGDGATAVSTWIIDKGQPIATPVP